MTGVTRGGDIRVAEPVLFEDYSAAADVFKGAITGVFG
jgi:hypothetical protein